MTSPLGRILIYSRNPDAMERFYMRHFGFQAQRRPDDRIVELAHPEGGTPILLHPAPARQRQGQNQIKLVFDVADVAGFCAARREDGLIFGPIHRADGYCFANAKDPDGNSVQVSSRAFAPEG